MKPITEYQDYRSFMLDYYEERKANSAFSWRNFAKDSGFTSSSYLNLVCHGKACLSRVGARRVAKAMDLSGEQTEFFVSMVTFEETQKDEVKKAAFEKMQVMVKNNKVRVAGDEVATYFESWWNPVLRELAPMMPGFTPEQIAKKFYFGITRVDVRDSLDFLVKNGFLKKVANHVYERTNKAVRGSSEAIPASIRSMHKQMALHAARSIEILPKSERNFSGLTVAASKKTYEQVVEELNKCRKKIASIVASADDADRIYRLNLQLFPITNGVSDEN